jgi:hypothetical protein
VAPALVEVTIDLGPDVLFELENRNRSEAKLDSNARFRRCAEGV